MTVRAHKAAVLARLREDPVLALKTFDSVVPDKTPVPYVVVYSDQAVWSSERLDFAQIAADFSFMIHAVGERPDQAQAVAERVYAQLMNFRPTVVGRSCWPMKAEASQPVRPDRDGEVTLWTAVDVFDLHSTPKG
ncbi:hypothetical protein ACQ3HE_06670 [Plantibacter auratus]|uniref:hypothetical protein n=1 Tax=Plantibacter auratus TaxID=272914 RepID=UPI003D3261AB